MEESCDGGVAAADWTAAELAARVQAGDRRAVEAMLEAAPDRAASAACAPLGPSGNSALHLAALLGGGEGGGEGGDEAAKMLRALLRGLPSGALAGVKNRNGDTCLMFAAKAHHRAAVSLLLEHGADWLATNRGGMTALHCAAGDGDCVFMLMAALKARRGAQYLASLECRKWVSVATGSAAGF